VNKSQWRLAIKTRDGFRCVKCGETSNVVAHHIKPHVLGGKLTMRNGKTLCRKCHGIAHRGEMSPKHLTKNKVRLPFYSINALIPITLHNALSDYAERMNFSLSDAVREAFLDFMNRRK